MWDFFLAYHPGPACRDTRVLGRGEPITIEAFPGVALTVDDLLG